MKRIVILLFLSLSFFVFNCSDDDSNPAGNIQLPDTLSGYYPGNVGSKFVYSIDALEKSSSLNSTTGTRTVIFTGIKNLNGPDYIEQTTTLVSGTDSVVSLSYFRKTDAAVYFYVDTTGLSEYLIDSLLSGISGVSVQADNEINILKRDFSSSPAWIAYNMNITYIFSFNIVKLSAIYAGTEDVELSLSSGTITKRAEKIKYELMISIPDLTGSPTIKTYNALIWFVKDIGIAKLEGNAAVLNALSGNGINLADTSKTMIQSLSSFELK